MTNQLLRSKPERQRFPRLGAPGSMVLYPTSDDPGKRSAEYDPEGEAVLIGRLTHHVELILFPGGNNRIRESSINRAWGSIDPQEARSRG